MIEPHLQDDAFLAEVREAESHASVETFDLWWLGQSGFLIHWNGRFILVDPYLSDSLTKKYSGTEKPHVRMTERVVAPERLDFVNIITSSHNHTDHLDPETLCSILPVASKVPLFVIPEANRQFVADRLHIEPDRPIGIDADESVEIGDIQITAVPAAHDEIELDEQGKCKCLGYLFHFGRWTIYHSGDTRWHERIIRSLLRWNIHHKIDVALLPINGHSPERRVAGNLNGKEAARLGRLIGAGVVIPCHYDMFEFNTAKPGEFVHEARSVGQHYQLLKSGERFQSRQIYAAGGAAPVVNQVLADYYTGKHILIGLTYTNPDGSVREQIQFDGHVVRISEADGILIYRRDTREEFSLPPDLASIRPAAPGEYRLRSSGEVVKDPELLTSWTINASKEERKQ